MRFPRRIENLIAEFRGLPKDRSRSIDRPAVPVDSLMEVLLERYEVGKIRPEQIITSRWADILGPDFAKRCSPQKIDRSGRLVVLVPNPILRRELIFDRRRIVREIQALPECGHIRDVHFIGG